MRCALLFMAALFAISCHHSKQPKLVQSVNFSNGYQLDKDWPQLPADFLLGNPTGIGIDSNQHIFIFHRAGREWPLIGSMPDNPISANTILMLDREDGKILTSWGDSLFIMPHGLTVDNKDNIWVTDVGLHQVFKLSHDGKLLMKIGEASVAGNDSAHFDKPTDVAVAKDGSFYVADGYGNSRIIKFSPEGKYLFEWGKKGDGEAEFGVPHAIDLDIDGNIYVADRENSRIQVFTVQGKFMKQFASKGFGRICSVNCNKKDGNFIAVDDDVSWFGSQHEGSNILLFDSLGSGTAKFGKEALKKQGITCWYHDVAEDNEGNIYVTDILGNSIQKFRRISDSADNKK